MSNLLKKSNNCDFSLSILQVSSLPVVSTDDEVSSSQSQLDENSSSGPCTDERTSTGTSSSGDGRPTPGGNDSEFENLLSPESSTASYPALQTVSHGQNHGKESFNSEQTETSNLVKVSSNPSLPIVSPGEHHGSGRESEAVPPTHEFVGKDVSNAGLQFVGQGQNRGGVESSSIPKQESGVINGEFVRKEESNPDLWVERPEHNHGGEIVETVDVNRTIQGGIEEDNRTIDEGTENAKNINDEYNEIVQEISKEKVENIPGESELIHVKTGTDKIETHDEAISEEKLEFRDVYREGAVDNKETRVNNDNITEICEVNKNVTKVCSDVETIDNQRENHTNSESANKTVRNEDVKRCENLEADIREEPSEQILVKPDLNEEIPRDRFSENEIFESERPIVGGKETTEESILNRNSEEHKSDQNHQNIAQNVEDNTNQTIVQSIADNTNQISVQTIHTPSNKIHIETFTTPTEILNTNYVVEISQPGGHVVSPSKKLESLNKSVSQEEVAAEEQMPTFIPDSNIDAYSKGNNSSNGQTITSLGEVKNINLTQGTRNERTNEPIESMENIAVANNGGIHVDSFQNEANGVGSSKISLEGAFISTENEASIQAISKSHFDDPSPVEDQSSQDSSQGKLTNVNMYKDSSSSAFNNSASTVQQVVKPHNNFVRNDLEMVREKNTNLTKEKGSSVSGTPCISVSNLKHSGEAEQGVSEVGASQDSTEENHLRGTNSIQGVSQTSFHGGTSFNLASSPDCYIEEKSIVDSIQGGPQSSSSRQGGICDNATPSMNQSRDNGEAQSRLIGKSKNISNFNKIFFILGLKFNDKTFHLALSSRGYTQNEANSFQKTLDVTKK